MHKNVTIFPRLRVEDKPSTGRLQRKGVLVVVRARDAILSRIDSIIQPLLSHRKRLVKVAALFHDI